MLKIIVLCLMGFTAAFVDSIAGGGGLISVPGFLMAGLDPHIALGTNKFCATSGSFTSSLKFASSGKVNFKLLKYLIPFTLTGSVLGVTIVQFISPDFLRGIVLVLVLIIGIYSLFSKSLGRKDNFSGMTKLNLFYGIVLAFSLGFYDGFFGPGTGSFLIFGFIKIFKFDFTKSIGNAKFLNFVSNISALIMFSLHHQIQYKLGLPVAIFMIIGARLGTKLAIKNGVKIIKPIFVTISLAIAIKMMFEL